MEIFVASYEHDREFEVIIGAFDSREKAQAALDGCNLGDYKNIYELQLNEVVNTKETQ